MSDNLVKDSNLKANKKKRIQCKNCKTQFKGNFCPNCGQSTSEFEKPFRFLIIDLVGNVFAFDTRFWNSLKSLITRPGKYTEDYLNGYRARYMPPFRLNVFISFLFFVLLSNYITDNVDLNDLDKQKIESKLIGADLDTTSQAQLLDSKYVTFNSNGNKDAKSSEEDGSWSIGLGESEGSGTKEIMSILNNPGIYINSFLKYLSWAIFLLMPVYAAFQWLFYRKDRKYYYHHLIFSINQHSFIYLLITLILVIKLITPKNNYNLENYLFLILPVYMFIANKQLYGKTWLGTVFRMLSVFLLYSITLLVGVGLVFVFWVGNQFVE